MKSDSPGTHSGLRPSGSKTDPVIERQYYLAWHSIPGIGPQQLLKIRDHFGSFFVAWQTTTDPDADWQRWLDKMKTPRQMVDPSIKAQVRHGDDDFLTLLDHEYPNRLAATYPHTLLYYRGNLQTLSTTKMLAVVGSRQLPDYHRQALRLVLSGLAGQQVTIVSGLAFGADALAHELALEYHLPTIAVLGSGLGDYDIYPRQNFSLAQRIIKNHGLLLSPFATGTAIDKHNFPVRNTIIAGLSPITLVVCAASKSGALITAQLAIDAGHDVLTIPGPINDPLSAGTNNLLRQGAQAITSSEDLLQALNLQQKLNRNEASYNTKDRTQQSLIASLAAGPKRFEDLIRDCQAIDSHLITVAVTQLELNGWIERRPGNVIALRY